MTANREANRPGASTSRVRQIEKWLDWWERSFRREGDYAEAVRFADDMRILTALPGKDLRAAIEERGPRDA